MTDPNRDRQDEELIALRSIFGDDWRDLPPKKTAWGTVVDEGWWEVVLRARDDERVSAILRGKFPKQYPNTAPQLSVVDGKGLSADHVHVLNKQIQAQAKAKAGDAMIYDLVEFAQDWITDNHLSLPNLNEVIPNLMEQMAQREQAQRDAESAKLQAEREERQALAAQQERLLTEKIQLDASRKSERARQAEQDEEVRKRKESLAVLADGELEDRVLSLDEDIAVEGHQGSWKSWVLFGGKREMLWTTYTAEPVGSNGSFVRTSQPSITVYVVDFPSAYYSTVQGKKKVEALAHEVTRLREIHSEHVQRILGVKKALSPKGWERLYILGESAQSTRLTEWMARDGSGEAPAKHHLAQVLQGIAEIHRCKATQKQLDPELVQVVLESGGGARFRLCGTSFARRIGDLHLSNPFLRTYQDPVPDAWKSPEEIEAPHDYSTRRDVWQVALLFLQLLFGPQCLWVYPNLDVLLQHASSTSESTVDLLRAMMHPNPKKRLSADEALERLKSVERGVAVSSSLRIDKSTSSNGPPISPRDLLGTSPVFGRFGSYFPQSSGPRQSRYREDFIEVEFLGKGGFGEVVKARNKLDGRSYAIKKVKLRNGDDQQKVYREVQNMSGVNHQYIVRYFTCWLEDVQPPEPEPATPSEEGTDTASATESDETDIFKPNFDDLSFSRPETSRSASFPAVRFANDEEDEDDSSDTDSDASDDTIPDPSSRPRPPARAIVQPKPSMSVTDATSEEHNVKTILYIAMEFVERQTLRELISAGISEQEGWILLKQILEALAHLASIKIVHRDLKPSNILINSRGQVKIADFGLSTTDISADPVSSVTLPTDGPVGHEIDRTSNIGTGLYIAPEVAVSRSYDEKADMYSLGIIFFEMSFRFSTQMERVQLLTQLRTPPVPFPAAWTGMVDQRKIITMLLQHDPSKRPTAEQLLRDPLLPNPERDQQKYIEAIQEVSNPSSAYHSLLVDKLFDPDHRRYGSTVDNRLDDYTYDNPADDDLQVWTTVVQQRVVLLFQRHGAVETHLPLLLPETSLLHAFPANGKPAKLLDPAGKLVRLPHSNLLAMARNATRRHIERIKRYHVGDRYEAKFEGQPSTTGELSFDIVSPIRSFAAEAELLDLTDKVLSEFKGSRTPAFAEYELHVSHEGVLAAIMGAVPEKCRADVLRIFKDAGPSWTSEVKTRLNGLVGISRPLQDEIEQCCTGGDFAVVRPKLEAVLTSASSRRKLSPALDELEAILHLARSTGVTRKVVFRPFMSRHAQLFRGGFMFECVRRSSRSTSASVPSSPTSSREILVYGGRYDSLLDHFRDPAAPKDTLTSRVYGVGLSIAPDLMARVVRKSESALSGRLMNKDVESERSFGYWTPARCDVYIVATGLDLAGRMGILGELWRAGVRADMQYEDDRTQLEVERECLDQNTLFLLVPRANTKVVKVRPILKKGSEVEVPRHDLASFLRQAIAEQRRIDAAYASVDVSGVVTAAPSGSNDRTSEVEIRLVLPPEPQTSARNSKGRPIRKHRHASKPIYYEKAEEFASRTGSSLPILAIDLDPALISRLTLNTSWVTEEDVWRGILSEMHTSERKYAEQVRTAVKEMRDKYREKDALGVGVGSGGSSGAGGPERAGGAGMVPGSSAGVVIAVPGTAMGGIGQGQGGSGGRREGAGWMWLFSVREGRGCLLQFMK